MKMFDINRTIEEIKNSSNIDNLGMILMHNGIVRATSKDGRKISFMELDYDEKKLKELVEYANKQSFVEKCVVWINKGKLNIGDDIMFVVLAGTDRKRLLPLFEEIIEKLKKEIVKEIER
ncbi:molybdenum cofactor biosynthesis protein MoaE [Hippea alviniae]|uniref:molybdenum cofactor biosynthesis protein MoaE n=1 Tax=Hippea alviniae TaxID=1279027 RepID=UPI0003B4B86A|nr:molybdenum cofactor biosynthesis protein MoaE [Hippea alviniae]